MKIYVDLVFILNFLFDLLLLLVVGTILRRNASIKKIVISAFVGALSIFVLFLEITALQLFFIKILISISMVFIAFGYKGIKYVMRNLFYLYTSSLLLGCFLYFLNITFSYKQQGLLFYHDGFSINFIVLIILSPIILYAYSSQALNLKNNYSNYYQVNLYFRSGMKKMVSAFLDTGNKLIDPYLQRPIILVNRKEIEGLYHEHDVVLVPYDTLNTHGLLTCVIPEKIYIEGIGLKYKVLIGISEETIKMDGIDCLLHTKLMEG